MRTTIFTTVLAAGLASAAVAADLPVVTKAPVAPPPGPQFFSWIEGGYSAFHLAKIHAFDFSPSGLVPLAPLFFDIDDGWYGRGELGFVPAQRIGLIDAIGLFVGYRKGSNDVSKFGDVGLSYLSPSSGYSSVVLADATGTAEQDFALLDGQLRLKHAPATWPGMTVNLEPFLGRMRHKVFATSSGLVTVERTARIKADVYGVQGAIEGQRRITETLSVRGRASLGVYHMNVDGEFRFSVVSFLREDRLSKDLTGLRAGAEIGVDFAFAPNVSLGVTAGIDHWSEMPFPRLTQFAAPPIGIDAKGLTDYFVGVRLTVVTGAR